MDVLRCPPSVTHFCEVVVCNCLDIKITALTEAVENPAGLLGLFQKASQKIFYSSASHLGFIMKQLPKEVYEQIFSFN
jgi:hypothetical protein